MKTGNLIVEKTFDFALNIIEFYIQLKENDEFVLSKQLLRSGTSIGANVEEAIAAQSKKDFINKMSIAAKEARETKYWLRLLDKSNLTQLDCKTHLEGIEHILNILSKIILTSKNSLDKN